MLDMENKSAAGGATIADRFKLDLADPNAKKPGMGKGALCAVIVGVIGLVVSGLLCFTLYSHWEFLQSA